MNLKKIVNQLIGGKVIVADLKNKFSEVQRLFTEYNLHHLPVAYDGKLIGIISSTDLMRWYAEESHKLEKLDAEAIDDAISIEELMTREPITVSPDDKITLATEILATHKFQSLPVVKEGKVVGIITTRDLVKHWDKLYKREAESLF